MRFKAIWCGVLAAAALAPAARADDAPERQPLNDAWWTGPLLANTAATLPQGHFAGETYVFDGATTGRYDTRGRWQGAAHADDYGSQSFVTYGVTDRFTLALIPRLSYDRIGRGQSSAEVGFGDVTLMGQYKLNQFREGSWLPTSSIALAETFPTGRYDRLDRPADGFGGGAYTSQVSWYNQTYWWAPTGRIVRARLDFTWSTSSRAAVEGVSVFGTPAGFHGNGKPGDSLLSILSFEYNASRHWVAAVDVADERFAGTVVDGTVGPAQYRANSGWGGVRFVAPAVEYNWNGNVGLIVGARIPVGGRNTSAGVTPVAALNYAF
ncbi:MAG TPA: transporter [Caulobacteraceae bacterium]|jgi:hypothetical protein